MNKKANIQIVSREGNTVHFLPAASPSRTALFGNVVKEARTKKRISQQEMAELMGVSRYTIMNWEQNKNKPECDMLPRLCSILDITANDLFGMKTEYTSVERDLISSFRLLKPSTQRVVTSLIDSMADKELAAHEEMLVNTTRIIDEQPGAIAAGSATSGIDISEIPPSPFFVRINDKTRKADAVIRVSGHSMEPAYSPGDMVLFQYANTADIGDDVVVCWAGRAFIKRLAGDNTLYSVNPDIPFEYEGDGSDIRILGKVMGVLETADKPSESDIDALQELFSDKLAEYDRMHGR